MSEVKPEAIEPPAEEPGALHCWHRSPKLHSNIRLHTDIRCCRCGEDRCVTLKHMPPTGHGEHAPVEEWRYVPTELIKAKGCPGEGK